MPSQPSSFPVLDTYLSSNKRWAEDVKKQEPDFFEKGAKGQSPGALWIGCADSRAAENVICARRPGELFVHRNIANRFAADDVSANAVLEYAVKFLKVGHVVVVGHTKCGGCIAAHGAGSAKADDSHSAAPVSALSEFLAPLIKLDSTLPAGASVDDLIKANVKESVKAVVESSAIKENWSAKKAPGDSVVWVHGWVYDLESGVIQDLGISEGPANWEELTKDAAA